MPISRMPCDPIAICFCLDHRLLAEESRKQSRIWNYSIIIDMFYDSHMTNLAGSDMAVVYDFCLLLLVVLQVSARLALTTSTV